MKVNFLDLKAQYLSIKTEIDEAIQSVLDKSAFAAGPFVKSFEANFAKRQGARYCVGVNNGTSALHAAMMAMNIGPGDEVIVPANTFFATPEAVSLAGAVPVFVDCESQYYNIDPNRIEKALSAKTKAIIAVNLYGQPAQLKEVKKIADKHGLIFLEDCAQSHLAELDGQTTGTFGVCGCFSFYPGKNLGAYGEGGAIITDDETLYNKLMMIRDHGSAKKYYHDIIGHNYRMEGFQGAILDVKLRHLDAWTDIRRRNAALYRRFLIDCKEIVLPEEMAGAKHVYHLFVIRSKERDKLQQYLQDNSVYTGIHYPIPCHLQKAYAGLGYKKGAFLISESYADQILSLPMSEMLSEDEISYVADKIIAFLQK
jgi:dTDP-4-amino-4,6-dideoxygalactose transaminase